MIRSIDIFIGVVAITVCASQACKPQPVRSTSPAQDIHVSKFLNLTSPDGNLKSYGTKADVTSCARNDSQSFSFVANERKFYHCQASAPTAIPDSGAIESKCSQFDFIVDVAPTGGAQLETNIKFLGMSCDGSTYLIKEENGLIPLLSSANIDLGEKEILLRASYLEGKLGKRAPIMQPASLFLERATAMRWSSLPATIEVSPGGLSGSNSFAFLSLNSDGVICSYKSSSPDAYQLVKCAEGGLADVTQDDGINGGTPVELRSDKLVSIDSVKFAIAGAAAGYITSAVVSISFE